MGLIGSLANTAYKINEAIMYSTFPISIIMSIINLSSYNTDPAFDQFLNMMNHLNLIFFIADFINKNFGPVVSTTFMAVGLIGGTFLKMAFQRVLNLSQQTASTLQVAFIYLLLNLIFNSWATLTFFINYVFSPMLNSSSVPYTQLPLVTFYHGFVAIFDFVTMFGAVMSFIYVLMATGMWSEM